MGADRLQLFSHRVEIVVPEQVDIAGRGLRAVLQAGVRKPVDDNVIIGPHQALDDPKASGPAGREKADMLDVEEPRDSAFQRKRHRRVAEQDRRPGAMDAVLLDRMSGRGLDVGMPGKRQVILRPEVDPLKLSAGVVVRHDVPPGTRFGRPPIRPQLVVSSPVLPLVEAVDAVDDVGAAQRAVILHAPVQGGRVRCCRLSIRRSHAFYGGHVRTS